MGLERLGRRLGPGQQRRLHHVAAEERVELGQLLGGEVVAVPPEPVGALGGVEVAPGPLPAAPAVAAGLLGRLDGVARLAERGPARRSSAWPIQIR